MNDARAAARTWATTWQRCWEALDADPIVALYAEDATFSSHPARKAHQGQAGVREYIEGAFGDESEVRAWFGGADRRWRSCRGQLVGRPARGRRRGDAGGHIGAPLRRRWIGGRPVGCLAPGTGSQRAARGLGRLATRQIGKSRHLCCRDPPGCCVDVLHVLSTRATGIVHRVVETRLRAIR